MPSCITKGEQVELRGRRRGGIVVVVVVSGNIDKEQQLFPILPPIIYESDSTGAADDSPLAPVESEHGCQTATARFLDCICLALRASGLATLQNWIPSFPWIAPGWRI